jgi:hypothetical protein
MTAPVEPAGLALPPAPPAPLPRRAFVLLLLVHLGLVGIALVAPLPLLATGDSRFRANVLWERFKEGGWGMWGITFSHLLVAAALAVLGGLLIRGKRVPGAILFGLALSPFLIGAFGAAMGQRRVADALAGDVVDPAQKARILAAGASELSNVWLYGGVASGFLLYVAAAAATMGLAAIDTAPLGERPKSSAWALALPAAVAAAIVAFVARAALHVPWGGLDMLVVLALFSAGLFAALGGRPLPALVKGRDEDEAGPAFRVLLAAAFATAACVALLDRAALAATMRPVLGALEGESLSAADRESILVAELMPAYVGRPILAVVDALAALAVFAAPLAAGRGARRKLSISVAAGGAAAVVTALVALLAGRSFEGALADLDARYGKPEQAIAAAGIALPAAGAGASPLAGAVDLLVKRDGSVVDQRPSEEVLRSHHAPVVAAEASLPFEDLAGKLGATLGGKEANDTIALVVAPAEKHDRSKVGPLAGLLGPDLSGYEIVVNRRLADGLPARSRSGYPWDGPESRGKVLVVLPEGDTARLAVVSRTNVADLGDAIVLRERLPLAGSSADRSRIAAAIRDQYPGLKTVLLVPAKADTTAGVLATLAALTGAVASRDRELVVTLDRPSLDQAPSTAARAKEGGAVSVRETRISGLLAKEPVLRTLLKHRASFRQCRDKAKAGGEPPPERASLRIVLDDRGKAKKTTVEPAGARVFNACIEAAVDAISWPPTESGIATVTTRLDFE